MQRNWQSKRIGFMILQTEQDREHFALTREQRRLLS
jgi:hypothetical protein